jgi:hypothetical protein
MFKNNIHATLIAFGKPCPVSDLFGVAGRKQLQSLKIPEPWHVAVVDALRRIDDLDEEIDQRQKRGRDGKPPPGAAQCPAGPTTMWQQHISRALPLQLQLTGSIPLAGPRPSRLTRTGC